MQKQTSRQIQAQKTKKKIYHAAVDLFNKQGFDNTTIEDISRKAGVSVGAFYHYYPSKSEIYTELYKMIDEYYESTVEPKLNKEDYFDNIVLFFQYYGAYNQSRGTDAVKQLYFALNPLFVDKNRYMYQLLSNILKQGEQAGHLTKEMTIDEAEEFLLVIARGLVFDWLLHGGEYDLETKLSGYIESMRQVLVR